MESCSPSAAATTIPESFLAFAGASDPADILDPFRRLTDHQLDQELSRFGGRVRGNANIFLGMLPEAQRRKLYRRRGKRGTVHYANHLSSLASTTTKGFFKVWNKLEGFPCLRWVLAKGKAGWTKVRVARRIATPENEASLAEKCVTLTRRGLARFIEQMRKQSGKHKKRRKSPSPRPDTAPEATPDATLGPTPGTTPDATLGRTPGTTPDATLGPTLGPASDTTPDATLRTALDTAPDDDHDDGSGEKGGARVKGPVAGKRLRRKRRFFDDLEIWMEDRLIAMKDQLEKELGVWLTSTRFAGLLMDGFSMKDVKVRHFLHSEVLDPETGKILVSTSRGIKVVDPEECVKRFELEMAVRLRQDELHRECSVMDPGSSNGGSKARQPRPLNAAFSKAMLPGIDRRADSDEIVPGICWEEHDESPESKWAKGEIEELDSINAMGRKSEPSRADGETPLYETGATEDPSPGSGHTGRAFPGQKASRRPRDSMASRDPKDLMGQRDPRDPSRFIPADVLLWIDAMHGGFCATEGCNDRAEILHHVDRFCLNPCPDPRRLVPLCRPCENLAHEGLFEDEARLATNGRVRWERRMETEEDRAKARVDRKVSKNRFRGS